MQIIVVIICNDNFYIQKSKHYYANKATVVVCSFICLLFMLNGFLYLIIFLFWSYCFVQVSNCFALP